MTGPLGMRSMVSDAFMTTNGALDRAPVTDPVELT